MHLLGGQREALCGRERNLCCSITYSEAEKRRFAGNAAKFDLFDKKFDRFSEDFIVPVLLPFCYRLGFS